MKGFYKDFILLLDFNSLYPSIIREYNVCFSKIRRPLVGLGSYYRSKDRPKKKDQMEVEEEEWEVVPPPKEECEEKKWGFLPQLIDKIVQTRKACKKSMKTASAEQIIMLDIKQKCFKLVANSIYGCLGFSISRFYSKHLAALITRMGRKALLRAKDIAGEMGRKPPKKTKTGQWATDASTLDRFGDHEIVAAIQDWRRLSKLMGTYVDALPRLIGEDGRIHTSFNQAVAATGRLSSEDPNLQNIPIRTEDGRQLRRAFVPGDEGWTMLMWLGGRGTDWMAGFDLDLGGFRRLVDGLR